MVIQKKVVLLQSDFERIVGDFDLIGIFFLNTERFLIEKKIIEILKQQKCSIRKEFYLALVSLVRHKKDFPSILIKQ